jgi:hypothetical protein
MIIRAFTWVDESHRKLWGFGTKGEKIFIFWGKFGSSRVTIKEVDNIEIPESMVAKKLQFGYTEITDFAKLPDFIKD